MDRKLRIAIDCRIADGKQGVGTAVLALAKALSESPVLHQEYTFIVLEEMRDWLAPYIYGPCSIHGIAPSSVSMAKAALRHIAPLRFLWQKVRGGLEYVARSDGFIESARFDLVHFPTQAAYLTSIPSIYQPWDLQHIHLPEFFDDIEIGMRDRTYRAFSHQATWVCVQTEWTRQDVIKNLGVSEEKVVAIPWGSVLDAYTSPTSDIVQATRDKYELPDQFFFYPAVTWPHKNHELILRSLAWLKKERQIAPKVYFTGASTPHRDTLDRLSAELEVTDQVRFLGFLSPEELQSMFSLATAMIFASRFEGFGLPLLEAFQSKLPILCSTASTLPEVAKQAALYFDPDAPDQLADCMVTILNSESTRQDLARNGTATLSHYSIQNTVSAFQALYDKTASRQVP